MKKAEKRTIFGADDNITEQCLKALYKVTNWLYRYRMSREKSDCYTISYLSSATENYQGSVIFL